MQERLGGGLTQEEIERAVREATGDELFVVFAPKTTPPVQAVRLTLERLNELGRVRWLLTYILVLADTNVRLRRAIVSAFPEVLSSLPSVDQQVERLLGYLGDVKNAILQPEYLLDRRALRPKLEAVSRTIEMLSSYKNLHECLHGLQLRLIFRPPAGAGSDPQSRLNDLQSCQTETKIANTKARAEAATLANFPDLQAAELTWIVMLERLITEWQRALDNRDSEAASTYLIAAQRIVSVQLCELNKKIFETARQLPFADIIDALPPEMENRQNALYIAFADAIHDLNPTVRARALEHKIWQDVDDELSLIDGLSPHVVTQELVEHWLVLKSLVLWLANLDPDAEWSKKARQHIVQIDDQFATERSDLDVKGLFEGIRRLIRFRYFEVDAALKSDCKSLGKVDGPLKSFMDA